MDVTAGSSLETHVNQLLNDFDSDSSKLEANNSYYEATYRPETIGMSVPPPMRKLMAHLGWARTYLGAIEGRLDIEGFRMVNSSGVGKANKQLWQWWQSNRMDVEAGLAHTEALIHGRAYVTIANPLVGQIDPLTDPDAPIIKVESPRDIHAEIDPISGRVTRALRKYTIKNPVGVDVLKVTLYLPNMNVGLVQGNTGWVEEWRNEHKLGITTVVPIFNKERIKQNQGISEIKPELRSKIDAASRLLMNLQATAELMAIPQRLLFGLEESEIQKIEGRGGWEAYIANILAFTDPGGKATQFAAAELRNFAEGMKVLREEASTITGLGPQYFHFGMDNPASAEAMQASEVRLVKLCERKCRIFGEAWETVMRTAMLVMNPGKKLPSEAFRMEVIWRNPATPTFAAKADAITKLVGTTSPDGRSVLPIEGARVDLGYTPEQISEFEQWDLKAKRNSPVARLADMYGQSATETPPPPGAPAPEKTPTPPGGDEQK